LIETFDGVDEIVTIPDKINFFEYFKLVLKLDNYNFDIIIDWHGNFRSWLAGKTITATRRLVYPKRRLERMFLVKRKKLPSKWPHTIDLYNNCIRQLGGTVAASRPVIKAPHIIENDSLFKQESDSSYIVIAPGAAHYNKQWPVERFVETALALNREHHIKIVWAVTQTDREKFPRKIISEDDFIELVDCPVEKLAGYITGAHLTIANDSGIAHLSSAVGTPVVAVFGPTHPALGFSPRGLQDRVIEVDEYCRPCSRHGKKPCYREERYCLTKILPETVIEVAKDILNTVTNNNRAVFLDRDGTVIVEKHFLSNPGEIEFEKGAIEALKILKEHGFKIFIISNQSGVARGYFDINSVEKVNARLLELIADAGVKIDGIYYCPHHKKGTNQIYARECNCRKPAPEMVEHAAHHM